MFLGNVIPYRTFRRRRGLGQASSMGPDDVQAFLNANPGAAATVSLFQQQVSIYGYDQIDASNDTPISPGAPAGYAIPEQGTTWMDASGVYGNVTAYPDANGNLVWTADVSASAMANTNAPSYSSSFLQPLEDDLGTAGSTLASLQQQFQQALQNLLPSATSTEIMLAEVAAVGLIGYLLVRRIT